MPVAEDLRGKFNSPSREEAERLLQLAADPWQPTALMLVVWMLDNKHESRRLPSIRCELKESLRFRPWERVGRRGTGPRPEELRNAPYVQRDGGPGPAALRRRSPLAAV